MPNQNQQQIAQNTTAAMNQGVGDLSGKPVDIRAVQNVNLPGDIYEAHSVGGLTPVISETKGTYRPTQEDAYVITQTSSRPAAEVPSFLENSYNRIAQAARANNVRDGATANTVYISADADRTITVANAGDARTVVLVRDVETGQVNAGRLSYDHKPTDPVERARIQQAGGFVGENGRVSGSLAVSRAFGDHQFTGVTHTPDITQWKAGDLVNNPRYEVYIVNSCDGLYEGMNEKSLASITQQHLGIGPASPQQEQQLAKIFTNSALHTESADNITATVTKLSRNQTQDVIIGIYDGHGGSVTSNLAADAMRSIAAEPAPAYSHDVGLNSTPTPSPSLTPELTPKAPNFLNEYDAVTPRLNPETGQPEILVKIGPRDEALAVQAKLEQGGITSQRSRFPNSDEYYIRVPQENWQQANSISLASAGNTAAPTSQPTVAPTVNPNETAIYRIKPEGGIEASFPNTPEGLAAYRAQYPSQQPTVRPALEPRQQPVLEVYREPSIDPNPTRIYSSEEFARMRAAAGIPAARPQPSLTPSLRVQEVQMPDGTTASWKATMHGEYTEPQLRDAQALLLKQGVPQSSINFKPANEQRLQYLMVEPQYEAQLTDVFSGVAPKGMIMSGAAPPSGESGVVGGGESDVRGTSATSNATPGRNRFDGEMSVAGEADTVGLQPTPQGKIVLETNGSSALAPKPVESLGARPLAPVVEMKPPAPTVGATTATPPKGELLEMPSKAAPTQVPAPRARVLEMPSPTEVPRTAAAPVGEIIPPAKPIVTVQPINAPVGEIISPVKPVEMAPFQKEPITIEGSRGFSGLGSIEKATGAVSMATMGIGLADGVAKGDWGKVGTTTGGIAVTEGVNRGLVFGAGKIGGEVAGETAAKAVPVISEVIGAGFAVSDTISSIKEGNTRRGWLSGAEAGLYTTAGVCGAAAAFNFWNPVGWGAGAIAGVSVALAGTITAAKAISDTGRLGHFVDSSKIAGQKDIMDQVAKQTKAAQADPNQKNLHWDLAKKAMVVLHQVPIENQGNIDPQKIDSSIKQIPGNGYEKVVNEMAAFQQAYNQTMKGQPGFKPLNENGIIDKNTENAINDQYQQTQSLHANQQVQLQQKYNSSWDMSKAIVDGITDPKNGLDFARSLNKGKNSLSNDALREQLGLGTAEHPLTEAQLEKRVQELRHGKAEWKKSGDAGYNSDNAYAKAVKGSAQGAIEKFEGDTPAALATKINTAHQTAEQAAARRAEAKIAAENAKTTEALRNGVKTTVNVTADSAPQIETTSAQINTLIEEQPLPNFNVAPKLPGTGPDAAADLAAKPGNTLVTFNEKLPDGVIQPSIPVVGQVAPPAQQVAQAAQQNATFSVAKAPSFG